MNFIELLLPRVTPLLSVLHPHPCIPGWLPLSSWMTTAHLAFHCQTDLISKWEEKLSKGQKEEWEKVQFSLQMSKLLFSGLSQLTRAPTNATAKAAGAVGKRPEMVTVLSHWFRLVLGVGRELVTKAEQ